jgi:formylmethanofuran dehydrogenase subunit C
VPLKLTYKAETTLPVEVEGLTPDWTRDKSLVEIERFEVFQGNVKVPLGELFSVSGNPRDEQIEFVGDLSAVHWIGAKMTAGMIRIRGNAGRHVGSEMRGGEIQVDGDVSDWLAAEMKGGLIHVHGRAGGQPAAAYRGSQRGMTGGTVLVDGDVGHEAGHTMRRGLLAIGGKCGDFAAINMIAGTMLVLGDCGMRPAAGMRRGTLGLFGSTPPSVLSTFRPGPLCQPLFLQLIFRELQQRKFPLVDDLWHAQLRLYHGDYLMLGRGEILTREAS